MTSVSHLYTDFGRLADRPAPPGGADLEPEQITDLQVTSFEGGYKAGWDDAVKAKGEEQEQLTAEFVQQLQDMSFTHHEAYTKLSKSLQPLMTRFVTKLLPEVAHQSLGLHLMEQIGKLLEQQSEDVIELAVAPQTRAAVKELLEEKLAVPFSVCADSTLDSSQVYLRVSEAEREINLDEVVRGVSDAVDAFFETLEGETRHG